MGSKITEIDTRSAPEALLAELADYYVGYREQMDHWHRVLPGRILEELTNNDRSIGGITPRDAWSE